MKILVIAPHMDDEVLGCDGTIARHVNSGDEVYTCFVAHRVAISMRRKKQIRNGMCHGSQENIRI